MGAGISLTPLPAPETLFLLLGILVQLQYAVGLSYCILFCNNYNIYYILKQFPYPQFPLTNQ